VISKQLNDVELAAKEQAAAAERWVNNYPRKLLGWKSADTRFGQKLKAA